MRYHVLIAGLLITFVPCLDATACWRKSSGTAPYEANRTYAAGRASVAAPTYCWCCYADIWQRCELISVPCNELYVAYTTSPDTPPSAICTRTMLMAPTGPAASGAPPQVYPMVCDRRTHCLRFPRCCETAVEFYPIHWLGAPCRPGCGGGGCK